MRVSIQQEQPKDFISDIATYIWLYGGIFFWSMPRYHKRGYIARG